MGIHLSITSTVLPLFTMLFQKFVVSLTQLFTSYRPKFKYYCIKLYFRGVNCRGVNCRGFNCRGVNCRGSIVGGSIVGGSIVGGSIVGGSFVGHPNYKVNTEISNIQLVNNSPLRHPSTFWGHRQLTPQQLTPDN